MTERRRRMIRLVAAGLLLSLVLTIGVSFYTVSRGVWLFFEWNGTPRVIGLSVGQLVLQRESKLPTERLVFSNDFKESGWIMWRLWFKESFRLPHRAGRGDASSIHHYANALPLGWCVIANASLLAYWCVRHRSMFHPWRQGVCACCGYDLRASAGACPECGRAIEQTSNREGKTA